MKTIKLSIGEVRIRELTWKENNDCLAAAEVGDGVIKNTIYFAEAEKIMCDLEPKVVDNLSVADGNILRDAIREIIFRKDGDIKN